MTAATAHDVLIDLASAHVGARALQLVAHLGLADEITEEPRGAAALAPALGVDADALDRVLRLLEGRGIFERDESGQWGHTAVSQYLRGDHPASLRGYVRMSGSPFNWDTFTHLDHAVRTGEPSINVLHAGGWLGYLTAHPDQAATFQQAMTAKAHADVVALLAEYDFSRHERVADIGGGHGHLLRAVLELYPDLTGVLYELSDVADEVSPADRLEVVAGDFFVDALPAVDAYMLMNIIHDWDDDQAIAILQRVSAAAPSKDARVLLVESIMPDNKDDHRSKVLDVMMLAITGGRERTLTAYEALLRAGELELVRVLPTTTAFSVIEARPR